MTTHMHDLLNLLRDELNQLEDLLAGMRQREKLAYQDGYRQCLKDAHLQLAGLDSYQSVEPPASTERGITNGGDKTSKPVLGPVSTRAVKYIADHPGSTRTEIMKHGFVRGKKVIDNLCKAGLIRRETLPVAERKTREAFVRYYPA